MKVVQRRERDCYGAGIATISEEESQRVQRMGWKGYGGTCAAGTVQELEGIRRNVCGVCSGTSETGSAEHVQRVQWNE